MAGQVREIHGFSRSKSLSGMESQLWTKAFVIPGFREGHQTSNRYFHLECEPEWSLKSTKYEDWLFMMMTFTSNNFDAQFIWEVMILLHNQHSNVTKSVSSFVTPHRYWRNICSRLSRVGCIWIAIIKEIEYVTRLKFRWIFITVDKHYVLTPSLHSRVPTSVHLFGFCREYSLLPTIPGHVLWESVEHDRLNRGMR
jgi:hypothetical protein